MNGKVPTNHLDDLEPENSICCLPSTSVWQQKTVLWNCIDVHTGMYIYLRIHNAVSLKTEGRERQEQSNGSERLLQMLSSAMQQIDKK